MAIPARCARLGTGVDCLTDAGLRRVAVEFGLPFVGPDCRDWASESGGVHLVKIKPFAAKVHLCIFSCVTPKCGVALAHYLIHFHSGN